MNHFSSFCKYVWFYFWHLPWCTTAYLGILWYCSGDFWNCICESPARKASASSKQNNLIWRDLVCAIYYARCFLFCSDFKLVQSFLEMSSQGYTTPCLGLVVMQSRLFLLVGGAINETLDMQLLMKSSPSPATRILRWKKRARREENPDQEGLKFKHFLTLCNGVSATACDLFRVLLSNKFVTEAEKRRHSSSVLNSTKARSLTRIMRRTSTYVNWTLELRVKKVTNGCNFDRKLTLF